ncbi:coiled-coil domain-containing protein 103-like [Elysia marginata]|uniref:Coiled-coil domain-containing protein 103-like n=1 Tax=Elysia marginata TaxID=1093978 RepID=A0AAV4GAZ2_9GAST|nr:coiled-coil domain-containing protein 103-like [Elysia marginata]
MKVVTFFLPCTTNSVIMTSTKPSYDDDHLDFGKVEKEAKSLVDYDERYWVENSAKIRAVEQRVASYDEFREIVMAAHLKPLEKEDKISSMGTFTQVWNQSALRKSQKDATGADNEANAKDSKDQASFQVPQTGPEFLQRWKRECINLTQKREFLFAVGPSKMCELFKTDISGGLLGEFLECFLHEFSDSQALPVVELLESLSTSQRFSLSLAFLSKKEKEQLIALFEKLGSVHSTEEAASFEERLASLKRIYSV